MGRLNVNLASRDQLLLVPGLDEDTVDALIAAREGTAILDFALCDVVIPAPARRHLKTDGESTFARLLQLPLRPIVDKPSDLPGRHARR